MAFDGLFTFAMAKDLNKKLVGGKIEKIYQPEKVELIFNVYTKDGRKKLFASADSSAPRIHFTDLNPENPAVPETFCMVLRKHLQGSRIEDVIQYESERIIEIYFNTLDELGFSVTKRLIFEIMGKHSNIILVDEKTGKIVDSIKRVSIDVNRARQILPGMVYEYPPAQEKIPFKSPDALRFLSSANYTKDPKATLNSIGGISPAVARTISESLDSSKALAEIVNSLSTEEANCKIYLRDGAPVEFHCIQLSSINSDDIKVFDDLSAGVEFYFNGRNQSNKTKQQEASLLKTIKSHLDKLNLKKKRVSEDLLEAENSDHLRLYGELLTANLHMLKGGEEHVTVTNYYDNSKVSIPLDKRFSPSKNAQLYYKKYGKAMTSIKEKTVVLEQVNNEISYLSSVIQHIENARNIDDLKSIHQELVETGYIRKRKSKVKEKKPKFAPHEFTSPSGLKILVGRNNNENDQLTLKTADKTDLWFHTKDIPGSHVILFTKGAEPKDQDIHATAAIAAHFSKAKESANIPVDYALVKHIKKPSGAKPGMVIFKNNRTVWVDPSLPK